MAFERIPWCSSQLGEHQSVLLVTVASHFYLPGFQYSHSNTLNESNSNSDRNSEHVFYESGLEFCDLLAKSVMNLRFVTLWRQLRIVWRYIWHGSAFVFSWVVFVVRINDKLTAVCEPRERSRYSDCLRAGIRVPVRSRIFDKTRQSRYLTRNYLFTCKYYTRPIFTTCFGRDAPSSGQAEYNTSNYKSLLNCNINYNKT
jgi:hypothetical protein